MSGINGYHHLTLSTDGAQEDFDFYTKTLGLHSVKRTVLFDGVLPVYHLYYGSPTRASSIDSDRLTADCVIPSMAAPSETPPASRTAASCIRWRSFSFIAICYIGSRTIHQYRPLCMASSSLGGEAHRHGWRRNRMAGG